MADPTLVVGLGNPGPEYEATRHNLGRIAVDLYADDVGARLKPVKGIRARAAEIRDGDHRVVIGEPITYMNESGEAVAPLARYFKVEPDSIVVVHDDIDLPLGTIRVKQGGGDGGHNGLRSITRSLGTKEYVRVRLGVGRPSGREDPRDWVLKSFGKREWPEAEIAAREAVDVIRALLRDGLGPTQERTNARSDTLQEPPKRAIELRAEVPAPPEAVFDAWTTVEGARTFFAPAARIEARPRGAYELLFDPSAPDGTQGSEGCTIVAIEPPRLLVFTWNAPPSIPTVRDGEHFTRVRLRFEVSNGETVVHLAHTGWRSGKDWDEAFAYFERAWRTVLDRLVRSFTDGPIDWTA